MAKQTTLELWVGLFGVAGLLALSMLAFKVANLSASDISQGYRVAARFDNIGQFDLPVLLIFYRSLNLFVMVVYNVYHEWGNSFPNILLLYSDPIQILICHKLFSLFQDNFVGLPI